ncbi:alginate lyase family protein [Oceaniglobus ichthyenteri]|uniref:alginate lyase family protein n=1 Tax=Oceaniglobus ichthyenteri TaxID=2136177 RepID=UPI000D3B0FE8|nr:alginate lyase family protein [Oceaniglobus ichthyenteri]
MKPNHILPTLGLAVGLASPAIAGCFPPTEPVVTLDFGSRYVAEDASRATIDDESNAAVNAALAPVDDFIRDLAFAANTVTRHGAPEAALADCVVARIAAWAWADALSDLGSLTAQLSVGGRLAGIAEAYRQVRPFAEINHRTAAIERWLEKRSAEQIDFWEKDATHGARRGNLRAWASLAIFQVADLTGDDAARLWAFASAARILCSAREDGSLPQETGRGKWGLHYQFHAIAPLVTLAARAAPTDPALMTICNGALPRAVTYALDDYANGGLRTAEYSGQVQTYFDGTQNLEPHAIAWVPAYLTLTSSDAASALAAKTETLANSKLGGDQRLLWQGTQP